VIPKFIILGNFAVAGPPLSDNSITLTQYNNGWILLSADGEIIGQGNQAPGYELDLNAPARPLIAWPTPENLKK
jgi:hypothetical protein